MWALLAVLNFYKLRRCFFNFLEGSGLGAAFAGVRWKMHGIPDANWWATSALVLAIPAVLLILFA